MDYRIGHFFGTRVVLNCGTSDIFVSLGSIPLDSFLLRPGGMIYWDIWKGKLCISEPKNREFDLREWHGCYS